MIGINKNGIHITGLNTIGIPKISGSMIAGSVMTPIWLSMTSQNAAALAAGKPLPNIVTEEFRYLIFIGGSGTTIGLVVAMAFLAKSQQYKQLGKLSLLPGLFNINDPLIFGMPIVFNPVMWIPFLLMPIITVTLTYFSMYFGIVGKPIGVLSIPALSKRSSQLLSLLMLR